MPPLDVHNHKHVKHVIPHDATCNVWATNAQATSIHSTNLFIYFLFIYVILVHDVLKDQLMITKFLLAKFQKLMPGLFEGKVSAMCQVIKLKLES